MASSLVLQAVSAVEESSSAVKCDPYAKDSDPHNNGHGNDDCPPTPPPPDPCDTANASLNCCYYTPCCSFYPCCYPYLYATSEGTLDAEASNGTETAIAIYPCYCLDYATVDANGTYSEMPVPIYDCCYYSPCCYYDPCCYDVVVDTGEGATDGSSGDPVDAGPAPEPQTVTNDTEPEPQPPVSYPYYCGCYGPVPATESDGAASADEGDSVSMIYCPLEEEATAGSAPA